GAHFLEERREGRLDRRVNADLLVDVERQIVQSSRCGQAHDESPSIGAADAARYFCSARSLIRDSWVRQNRSNVSVHSRTGFSAVAFVRYKVCPPARRTSH